MNKRMIALAAMLSVVSLAAGLLLGPVVMKSSDVANALSDARLLQQIEELTARVEQLEQQQPAITLQTAGGRPNAAVPAIPYEQVPEGWHRREFNGQPYYIVPLASSRTHTP